MHNQRQSQSHTHMKQFKLNPKNSLEDMAKSRLFGRTKRGNFRPLLSMQDCYQNNILNKGFLQITKIIKKIKHLIKFNMKFDYRKIIIRFIHKIVFL